MLDQSFSIPFTALSDDSVLYVLDCFVFLFSAKFNRFAANPIKLNITVSVDRSKGKIVNNLIS